MQNYLVLFTLVLISLTSTAQKKLKYTAKGKQEVVRKKGQSIRYLIDSVVFSQKETTVYCDSAIFKRARNELKAYDNVKIINDSTLVKSDRLLYFGDDRVAKLREDVVYKRGFQELYTDHLDYSLDSEIAYYFNGGQLIDTTNILSSILGYFYAKENIARFYQSVVLTSPEFTLKTDTLRYNTLSKIAYSFGPTEITNKEGTIIYANGGEFRTEINQTEISSGNVVNQLNLCSKVNNITKGNNSYSVIEAFDYHFKAIGYKNVYEQQWYATSVCSVSGNTVYNNNGSGGGTCITRQQNDEIIVGTNISHSESMITKFKVQ